MPPPYGRRSAAGSITRSPSGICIRTAGENEHGICHRGARLLGRVPLLRRVFPADCPIIVPQSGKGAGPFDRGVCGQRVRAERADGLSAGALRGPAGGDPPPAGAVSAGGTAGGRLRGGGVSAGAGLSRGAAGEAGGGRAAGAGGLRRGGEAAAADAAALCRLLRHGRVRAGAGPAGRRRRARGERRVLYGRGRQGAADRLRRGLSGVDGGVPGSGQKGPARPAGAGPGVHCRPGDRLHRLLRHGEYPAGPGVGTAGAGGVPGAAGRRLSPGNSEPAGPRGAGASRGAAGAPGARGAGAAVPPAPLPGGRGGRRFAVGRAQRLGGDRGGAVHRAAGGPVPHGVGYRIQRPLGRRGGKERSP